MFTVHITGRDFQYGSNSCVVMIRPFLGRVYSRQALAKNCSSVSFSHEILSNLNNMYECCIHTEFTHFVFLWKQFDSFFISFAIEDSGVMGCHSPKKLLPWFHSEQLIVPSVHPGWSILMGFKFFTHVCNCSVETELIDKKQLCEKWSQLFLDLQQNVSTVFPCPLLLRLPLDNGDVARKIGHRAFCEFQQHLVRDMIPNSLWTFLFHSLPLLFGTWTNECALKDW